MKASYQASAVSPSIESNGLTGAGNDIPRLNLFAGGDEEAARCCNLRPAAREETGTQLEPEEEKTHLTVIPCDNFSPNSGTYKTHF